MPNSWWPRPSVLHCDIQQVGSIDRLPANRDRARGGRACTRRPPWSKERSPSFSFTGSYSRPGPRKYQHTQTLPARPSSSDPYEPTRRDGCNRAGLSPLARARGVRRRPCAQTLLLEHGDTFEDSTRVVHHRRLGHLLRVVDEERFGADARAAGSQFT